MDNKSENHSYLSFAINEEIYAAKVHSVVEVLEQQPITLIPKSPKHIKGVVSFRGEIIPVIDARTIMNIPDHPLSDYVIIVFTVKNENFDERHTVGTIADHVENVIEIKPLDIVPTTEINSIVDPKFTFGVFKDINRFVTILDTDKIFAISNNKPQYDL